MGWRRGGWDKRREGGMEEGRVGWRRGGWDGGGEGGMEEGRAGYKTKKIIK